MDHQARAGQQICRDIAWRIRNAPNQRRREIVDRAKVA
jgi:hypothetical protein